MKRTIVTSALPYINGVKHLGNLIGSLLPADIYTRYLRQKGEDVVAICGTDEHGAPAEIAAEVEGLDVKEYCDRMFEVQRDIYERFGLSFDHFGRSSRPENHRITKEIFRHLYANGHIVERSMVQLYDEVGKRFLPDRFVEGICPHCGFERARGDQCENCTRLLDATELISPRNALTGSTAIVQRTSRHLFLRLPHFEGRLREWIASKESYWPTTTVSIARKWLQEGLKDRCITRDLKWGISVPLDGFEDKVFYVWFDAPNAYIGITAEWARLQGQPDLWKRYWKDQDARVVQFMAKDNVPFHTVVWPAMLMGANDGYVLADFIKGFEYLNYEGGKFSTSLRRGVFTDSALAEFPADYWRFYLVTIAPERSDTAFTWVGFQQAIGNLADSLGNFVHRTLTFVNQYFEGRVPDAKHVRAADEQLWVRVGELIEKCDRELYQCNFSAWVRTLREIWAEGNRYFSDEAPWVTRKTSPADASAALHNSLRLCRAFAILSSPLIPSLAEEIFRQLNLAENPSRLSWSEALRQDALARGHRISRDVAPLCRKIDDERIAQLERRFSGREERQGHDRAHGH